MTLAERLGHPWLTVRVQITLGAVFVAAALPKIVDPPSFAHATYNYQIVPGSLVNLSALVLPWTELLLGLALVLGIWKRTAGFFIGALLLVFVAAIGLNLARGNVITCGCFDPAAAGWTREQKLADMRFVLLRDLGLLLLVLQVLWGTRREG